MSYKSSATKPSPPSNAEAESGVLSCLLREGDEGGDPSEKLSELAQEDFCDLRNRRIFLKLQQLSGAGKPIQLESLVGGNNDEQLGNLGGREYILLLAGEVPS